MSRSRGPANVTASAVIVLPRRQQPPSFYIPHLIVDLYVVHPAELEVVPREVVNLQLVRRGIHDECSGCIAVQGVHDAAAYLPWEQNSGVGHHRDRMVRQSQEVRGIEIRCR